jgi:hypothetical protein
MRMTGSPVKSPNTRCNGRANMYIELQCESSRLVGILPGRAAELSRREKRTELTDSFLGRAARAALVPPEGERCRPRKQHVFAWR